MKTSRKELSNTPLHSWSGSALLAESKNAANLWKNRPEFSDGNWSQYADYEERAAELVSRVIERLKKEPPKPGLDQITFFYQVAEYCRLGITKHGRAPRIGTLEADEIVDGEGGDGDDNFVGYEECDIVNEQQNEENEERALKIRALFKKVGVTNQDFTLFDMSATDFEDASGLSERHFRDKKFMRKQEILEKIRDKKLAGEFAKLMPGVALEL